MHVWNVLHAARWNKGRITQKSTSAHHRTNLSGYMFASKAFIDNRKKFLKQQHLLHHMSYNVVNFDRHTNGWDRLASLGHPSKFQRVSRFLLASLLHRRHSNEVNQTLYDVWPAGRLVDWYTIYTFLGAHANHIGLWDNNLKHVGYYS